MFSTGRGLDTVLARRFLSGRSVPAWGPQVLLRERHKLEAKRESSPLGGFAHYPVACPTYARDPTIMKSRPFLAGFLSRYRLIPACSHLALFAIVWIAAAIDPRPVLDGMARWGIWLLTLADFPFSVVGFSLIWDQRRLLGGLIWGCGGTLLWYVLGGVFFRSRLNRPAP